MIPLAVNPELLIAAAIVTMAASFLQASVGYGFGLVAAPLLVIVDIRLVPVPLILASLVTMFQVALQNRAALNLLAIRPLLVGMLAGSPIGALLLLALSSEAFIYLVIGVVSIGLAVSVFGLSVPINNQSQFVAGALSNIFGTTTGMGGAPLALLFQHETGPNIRAVLSSGFFVGGLFASTTLLLAGLINHESLWLALHLVPGLLAGGFVGKRFAHYIDRGYSRVAIIVITTLSVIYLLTSL